MAGDKTPDDSADLRQEALAFVARHERTVLDLASALIAAPSPNLPGDERAAAEVVHRALRELGLPPATVVAKEPHRPNLIVRIDAASPGPHLGLCGHLDTKPVGEAADRWTTDPFAPTIDGDRLAGLGSTDMKAAVAAMLVAGAAFASVAGRAAGSLSLIFTADEENGSLYGADHLVRSGALDVEAIVLGEPSGIERDWEAIRTVSRGFCGFRVVISGTQTHSSISDQRPTVNAVEAMARVLVGLRRELRPRFPAHPLCEAGPTVNLGVRTLGGVGYGVLPGHAEFWSDIRTTPGMTQSMMTEDIDAALARVAPEALGAEMRWEYAPGLGWVEPTAVAADHPMVRACQRAASDVLGASPPLAAFPGATDAWAFQAAGGIPTLAAFGPGLLPLAHGPNEWVSISSLLQASRMYALLALDYGEATAGH